MSNLRHQKLWRLLNFEVCLSCLSISHSSRWIWACSFNRPKCLLISLSVSCSLDESRCLVENESEENIIKYGDCHKFKFLFILRSGPCRFLIVISRKMSFLSLGTLVWDETHVCPHEWDLCACLTCITHSSIPFFHSIPIFLMALYMIEIPILYISTILIPFHLY